MYREFQAFTADTNLSSIEESLKEMYIDKTKRRLADLRDDNRFQSFFDTKTININGKDYPSLDKLINELNDIVTESGLLSRESLTIIHGDLCLPNILYDPRNEVLKVIDPRGKFGEFDIYGDPRYDFAKLRHSFVGHYEHLINNQFQVNGNLESAEITYNIYTTEAQNQRESRFDSILAAQTDTDVEIIRLIESLLFLSMVPLHNDSFDRQLCMLAQGIKKMYPHTSQ
jgi:hypothetical protein